MEIQWLLFPSDIIRVLFELNRISTDTRQLWRRASKQPRKNLLQSR